MPVRATDRPSHPQRSARWSAPPTSLSAAAHQNPHREQSEYDEDPDPTSVEAVEEHPEIEAIAEK
jgi:hypothetical protein